MLIRMSHTHSRQAMSSSMFIDKIVIASEGVLPWEVFVRGLDLGWVGVWEVAGYKKVGWGGFRRCHPICIHPGAGIGHPCHLAVMCQRYISRAKKEQKTYFLSREF